MAAGEHVVIHLRVRVVDLLLDRVQIRDELFAEVDELRRVWILGEPRVAVLHLVSNPTDGLDHVDDPCQLRADTETVDELLLEIGFGNRQTRVELDDERLGRRSAFHRQSQRVVPWNHRRIRPRFPGIEAGVRHPFRLPIREIPGHPVESRLGRELRLGFAAGAPVGMIGRVVLLAELAAQPPYERTVRVEDPECDLAFRLLRQVVGDDGAPRRVLAGTVPAAVRRAGVTPTHRRQRSEEVLLGRCDLRRHFAHRRQVVEDPGRAAEGPDHQVVPGDREIDNRDGRHVEAQRLPARTVVTREHDAALGAEIEHALTPRVLPHHVQIDLRIQARGQALPAATEVRGLEEVGGLVVQPVGVDHHIGGAGVPARGLDGADGPPLGDARRCHVAPILTAIPSQVHQAVVAAGPDEPGLDRRLRDREDRVVELDPGVVAGDRPPRPGLRGFIVAGQIGADRLPALAAVRGFEEHVGGVVDDLRVVGRDHDRGRPLKAVSEVDRPMARPVVGVDTDVRRLAGAPVITRDDAEVLTGPDDVGIEGVGNHVPGLTSPDPVPVRRQDSAAVEAVTGAGSRPEVLQAAHHPVGRGGVDRQVVELGDRHARPEPGLAAVRGQGDPGVAADNHPFGVFGVDPDVVVVPAAALDRASALAAVGRLEHRNLRKPHHVGVGRVDGQRRVVPGSLADPPRGADPGPLLAGVVGAEEAALLCLDQGVDALRLALRHPHADPSPDPFGKALALELLPGVTAVAGDVETTSRSARGHPPWGTPGLPQAGKEDPRVRRVETDIGGAGVRVLVQHLLPLRAAVGRPKDSTIRTGTERASEHRRKGDIRVVGMNGDGPDLTLGGPHPLPGLARVGRPVDAVAFGDVAADIGLSRTDPHHVRVRRRHSNGTDGRDRLFIEDRFPLAAAVDRLPDTARRGGRVVGQLVADHTGHPRNPTARGGADKAVLETTQWVVFLTCAPRFLGADQARDQEHR